MLTSYRFDSLKPGPHLVILGAVHGDEKCGPQAIQRLIAEFQHGQSVLARGSLTCLPICNPEAYVRNQRFYQRNLNRALYVKESPTAYEDFIDPILCRVLDEADVLLDLHSYQSKGDAFGFMGHSSQAEIDYCLDLGIRDFVYGWSDAFGKAGGDPRDAMGTVEYARSKGCIATTIECGHHHNDDAPEVGYQTIRRALNHLNMLPYDDPTEAEPHRFSKMQTVFFKEKPGEVAQAWRHYDVVKKGQKLAQYKVGDRIEARADGMVILPKLGADVGGEWFYFGVTTDCPSAKME